MEATIIRLDNVGSQAPMVVRSATFEEAFGDYSEARGKGRARRKKRKLERIANKREVRTERRKLKGDRQQERIERRRTRKEGRQGIRAEQQEARMGRRSRRLAMRQERGDARNLRKMTKTQGEQERENYATEQELYRDSLMPQDEQGGGGADDQQGGGGADDQQGGGGYSDDQQGGGGYSDDQQGGGGYSDDQQGGGGYSDDQQGGGGFQDGGNWATEPQYYEEEEIAYEDGGYGNEGAYGDDESYESSYDQEASEFADDSYFNVEGMDGKGAVVPPAVADTVNKLKNNEKAYKDLSVRRDERASAGAPTRGLDIQLQRCYGRICELRQQLDGYCNADGNPNERRRRKRALGRALGLGRRKRARVEYGGSEVPVSKNLNPEISNQRIEIPASSNFDAYSDLGRPVMVNGVTQSDYSDYSSDLLTDSAEPTTIDLFSNFDGNSGTTAKTVLSIAVGIGVGALAIYLAKRKGWI
jgi:hypothetical protein